MTVVSDYRALIQGTTWTDHVGQAAVLTYSFSTAPTDYVSSTSAAAAATFEPLSDADKNVVRAALAQWSAVSGITFYETTSHVGDLTFGFYNLQTLGVADSDDDVGDGTYPYSGNYIDSNGNPQSYNNFLTQGGDIYFDDNYRTSASFATDFAHVALHEIGHALGLKHPFDAGAYTLDPSLDNGSNTVMAYAGIRSATLEPLDVAAIQYLYGTKSGATHPITQTWNPVSQSLTVTGTSGADDLFGSGGNDIFYTNGGNDAVSGGEGDDTVFASGGPLTVNGGPGMDTVVTGLTYGGSIAVGGSGATRTINLPNTGTSQIFYNVERLVFTNGIYSTATNTLSSYQLQLQDNTAGTVDFISGNAYNGPVAGVNYEYVTITPDNLNITASQPNAFIHTGSGADAIDMRYVGGTNVLDGGAGSNFLVGGTGAGSLDNFYVDARGATADVWSTVANFHAGDNASIFGVTPQDFALNWYDNQGAAGYTGLTLHATAAGKPSASLTLAGYSQADLSNGRLTTTFGTVGDTKYMMIHANS